jgi:hypothetical protein
MTVANNLNVPINPPINIPTTFSNRKRDARGCYYTLLPKDEVGVTADTNNLKMIAADANGVWHASRKFISNAQCVAVPNQPGSNVVYNYVVFQSQNDSEPLVVIAKGKRHVSITKAILATHSDKKARFAGEIAFDKEGAIAWWDNRSGHYEPLALDAHNISIFPIEKFWSIRAQNRFFDGIYAPKFNRKKIVSNANELAAEISKVCGKVNHYQATHAINNYLRDNENKRYVPKAERQERHQVKYNAKQQEKQTKALASILAIWFRRQGFMEAALQLA